jgi:hypothetical protein
MGHGGSPAGGVQEAFECQPPIRTPLAGDVGAERAEDRESVERGAERPDAVGIPEGWDQRPRSPDVLGVAISPRARRSLLPLGILLDIAQVHLPGTGHRQVIVDLRHLPELHARHIEEGDEWPGEIGNAVLDFDAGIVGRELRDGGQAEESVADAARPLLDRDLRWGVAGARFTAEGSFGDAGRSAGPAFTDDAERERRVSAVAVFADGAEPGFADGRRLDRLATVEARGQFRHWHRIDRSGRGGTCRGRTAGEFAEPAVLSRVAGVGHRDTVTLNVAAPAVQVSEAVPQASGAASGQLFEHANFCENPTPPDPPP